MVSLIVRQAGLQDLLPLQTFYWRAECDALPATSVRTLEEAIDDRHMLVVCRSDDGSYAAAAATFGFAPRKAVGYVGEFAGAYVMEPYRRCGIQRILVSARLLDYAANDLPVKGTTASLISVVKQGNAASKKTLTKAGFVPLAAKPAWFEYEELAWYGKAVQNEWDYVCANNGMVREAYGHLDGLGLLGGEERVLTRRDPMEGDEEVSIRMDLPFLIDGAEDLRRIAVGDNPALLEPPPPDLALRGLLATDYAD